MIDTPLTRHPGVYKRADSAVYQFGLRAPKDLLSHYPTGWAHRCSLGTSDLRLANDKAKTLHAEFVARFSALRDGRPLPVNLTELRRSASSYVRRVLSTYDVRSVKYTAAEREERAASFAWQIGELRHCLANGGVPDWAGKPLHGFGYARSAESDAAMLPHLTTLYELCHEALTDSTRTFPLRVQRLQALSNIIDLESSEAVTAPSRLPAIVDGHRISDALGEWSKLNRPAKTVSAFTRHVGMFADLMGDPLLEQVDRVIANGFRDKLQAWAVEKKRTATTADNVIVSVRALFNVARDLGWVSSNPFERLAVTVGGKDTDDREPWTQDELVRLFNDPIWTAYRLPTERKAGRDAAYWLPLIACFTGARLSEIAQLWTDDITVVPGGEVIEFRASRERGQRLKTDKTWRAVPMHSELIRLGLPEYVAAQKVGPLFPLLPTSGANGAGGQFGQWFGDFKQEKGFPPSVKSMHSFRHLVASELRLKGASDSLADSITGHAGVTVARRVYSATIRRKAAELRSTMELLSFPDLKLRRVYPAG